MHFSIGSHTLTKAIAFNPSRKVFKATYGSNIFDVRSGCAPIQIHLMYQQATLGYALLNSDSAAANFVGVAS